MLLPEIFKVELKFDFALWKKLFKYAFPILIIGFAFSMNEMFGRILMNNLLPEDTSLKEIGIYSASFKLAILLSLFVQAFRLIMPELLFSFDRGRGNH